MINASAVYSPESPTSTKGRSPSLAVWMWSNTIVVPKRSAWAWNRAISSGPCTPSASAGEIGNDQAWGLNYQSIFSDRTFMEVRYNGWQTVDDNLSQTGSTEAAYFDYAPPGGGPATYWGGVLYPWTYDTSVDQLSVSLTTFADDFVAGDHDFKFGIQASRGDNNGKNYTSMNGSYYYHDSYDYYGEIYDYYYKVDGLPYWYGAKNDSIAAFVDDSWSLGKRLNLTL